MVIYRGRGSRQRGIEALDLVQWVEELRSAGLTEKRIVEITGFSRSTITNTCGPAYPGTRSTNGHKR